MQTLPVFLNAAGRVCLVVGGGKVGVRKAHAVLDSGSTVRLVCREPEPAGVPSGLHWLTGYYAPEHLEGVSLVCAAATPEVNRQVVADARARNIWVNSATEPDTGDFALPAVGRRGKVTLAVGTSGASPAAAAYLRDLLSGQVDDAITAWVALLSELRREVILRVAPDGHEAVFSRLAHPGWIERIRVEGIDPVREAMRVVVDVERGR